jgi:hypothetical protein
MKKKAHLYSFKVCAGRLSCARRTVGYADKLPHNKRMQTDLVAATRRLGR